MNSRTVSTEQRNIALILNKLLTDNKLTINQLSRETDLTFTTIRRMCTKPDSNPTLSSIIKIADFFRITSDQLIGHKPIFDPNDKHNPCFENWSKIPILTHSQVLDWPENIDEITEMANIKYTVTDIEVNKQVFAMTAIDDLLAPLFSNCCVLTY